MIAPWPPKKPRYKTKRLRDAITQAITDIDELRSDPTPETHNRRLTNIRNSLTDVINESPQS